MSNETQPNESCSHLRSYMNEVMAGLRYESMSLLVNELMLALERESYFINEFVYALSVHVEENKPTWKLAAKHLQQAANELGRIQRLEGTQR